jgi:hypothetical protein
MLENKNIWWINTILIGTEQAIGSYAWNLFNKNLFPFQQLGVGHRERMSMQLE